MSQVSRPYQFALGAVLVFGLLWLVFLRPSDGATTAAEPLPGEQAAAATAPGVQGLGNAVEKAQGAVATSNAAAAAGATANAQASGEATPAATAAATPTPAATPAPTEAAATTAQPTARKDPPGDPSRPILAAVEKGRVAVVLFYEGKAADDRAVRRAVRALPRRGGKVRVYLAPIRRVGRYEAITRGVQVLSAPTVLVIGRDRAARTIVGYTQTAEIDQLVDDTIARAKAATATEAPGSA